MAQPKAWMAWSSGKDSAWALHVARQLGEVDVVGLLTTVTDAYSRVSMHGVREELLIAQAEATDLPLYRVRIPAPCPNEVYESEMRIALESAARDGVTHVVFGDLFLEDIRAYREAQLARIGMTGVFPLWKRDTTALAREMIDGGLKAHLVCIDPRRMPRHLAGRAFDEALLQELPADVDPCGENGEFHTFACNGPMFAQPVAVEVGETVEREGFVFADLVSTDSVGYDEDRPALLTD